MYRIIVNMTAGNPAGARSLVCPTLVAILLVICCGKPLYSQSIRVKRIQLEDGLPEANMTSILQDRAGLVWVGGHQGIYRYNGYEHIQNQHNPEDSTSLSDNFVNTLFEDSHGNIWASTRSGLTCIEKGGATFSQYLVKPDVQTWENTINQTTEDGDGNIWFVNARHHFVIHDWENRDILIREYPEFPEINEKHVRGVYWDEPNRCLWLTVDRWVFRLKDGMVQRVDSISSKLPIQRITFYTDRSGTFWIGTKAKLLFIRPGSDEIETFQHGQGRIEIREITQDRFGNLWLATSGGLGMIRQGDQKVFFFTHDPADPHSMSMDLLMGVAPGMEGGIWIATPSGVDLLNLDSKEQYRFGYEAGTATQLSSATLFGMLPDGEGAVWVGGMEGLDRIQLDLEARWPDPLVLGVEKYNDKPSIPGIMKGQTICGLYRDENGLWASNGNGLFYIKDQGGVDFHRYYWHKGERHSINLVFEGVKDNQGHMWLGGARGLQEFDPEAKKFLNTQVLGKGTVFSLMADREGHIWAGGTSGVDQLTPDGEVLAHFEFDKKDSLSLGHNLIMDIMQDSRDRIWISTMGGGVNLFHPDSGTFTRFNESDGLLNNYVYGVLEDGKGMIWVGTASGLSRLDPTDGNIVNIRLDDELDKDGLNQMSFAQLSNGFFGAGVSDAGLLIFHPDSLFREKTLPSTFLTGLSVNYAPVRKEDGLLGGTPLTELKSLDFHYGHKSVVFEFAGYPALQPNRLTYQYRLKGFNTEWITVNHNRRIASYTNLPPGNFVFEAKACMGGKCNDHALLSLPIHVSPPFWQTWWFRLFGLMAFSALLILGVWFREREHYRKKLQAFRARQRLQKERERISRDLHDNIGARLTQIVRSLDVITFKGRSEPFTEIEPKLENLIDHTRDAMQLLRETIWAIQEESITVRDFAQKTRDYLSKYFELAENPPAWEVIVEVGEERALSPAQALNVFRIIQESVQNMVKHADASAFEIEMVVHPGEPLVIGISDNGKGFDLEEAMSRKGHYGLKNMQKRVEDIGGIIEFSAVPGSGTQLKIEV